MSLAGAAFAQGPPSRIEIRRGDEVVHTRPEPAGAVRVLFVGNSLTYFNELPWVFQRVVESRRAEPPVVVRFSGGSGRSFWEHRRVGEVERLLRQSSWDFVVLQGNSRWPFEVAQGSDESLAFLLAEVRRNGATPVLFESWPRHDQPEKHAEIGATFRRLAAEHEIALAPIGTAWEAAGEAGIDLYRDSIHPSLAGTYLAACVLAATVFELDPRRAIHTFPTSFEHVEHHRRSLVEERLDEATARKLQEVAWEVVVGRERESPRASR
jgi:hypothetical protein